MTNRDRRTERREEDRMTRRTPTEMAHAKLRTAVDKVERARHRVERAEEELAAARTAVKSAVVARDYAAAHPQLKHDTEPQPVEEGDR